MELKILLGAEAVAQGAIDAGISGVYAYPGTPSTEITEYIQNSFEANRRGIHSNWSANEKTAYETALGMSYAGKRSLVCMKYVGLNVAADPFINSAVTGVHGGLVLAVADDPSMHSSQNEQDSRFFGKFAMIPVLEPSDQQQTYDMIHEGFEISEKIRIPVMVRITTRLSHSRAGVLTREPRQQNQLSLPPAPFQFMLLPFFARKNYNSLLQKQKEIQLLADGSTHNIYSEGKDRSLGIIACGIAYNYLMENYIGIKCPYPVVKISHYPLPAEQVRRLEKNCDEILVLEEGYPLVEELLRDFFGKGRQISGRLNGKIPRAGELNPDHVAHALGLEVIPGQKVPDMVVNRPPALCKGCGHHDVCLALNEAMAPYGQGRVLSDIGCYTLAALPPYNTVDTCVDMGASITMAKGAADAGLNPSIALIGDSTFTHSGITGLLDCVNENSDVVIIISDNEAIAMTGGQDSSAAGKTEKICQGLGVHPDHIRNVVPLAKNHAEMVKIIREEIAYKGVSVIISSRECIQKSARSKREKRVIRQNEEV